MCRHNACYLQTLHEVWCDVSDSKKKDGTIHRALASKAHEHEDDSEDNTQDGSEYETEEDSLF